MSDVLVLNEGISKGRKAKMRKFKFSRVRFPRLRSGVSEMGLGRRFKIGRMKRRSFSPMRMEAVPWTKHSRSHGWFKRRSGSLLRPFMKKMWSTYKRGGWGKKRRASSMIPLPMGRPLFPALPSGVHLGLGSNDDLGLMRMSGGWLPAINLLGVGSMGLGLVSVYYVPKLPFIPEMLKTGIGRIGLQLGTGILGNALLTKIVKRPDLGYHFFTGALAGTLVDVLNIYVLKGAIPLQSNVGLGVYVDRPAPQSTGKYVDRGEVLNASDDDDDE